MAQLPKSYLLLFTAVVALASTGAAAQAPAPVSKGAPHGKDASRGQWPKMLEPPPVAAPAPSAAQAPAGQVPTAKGAAAQSPAAVADAAEGAQLQWTPAEVEAARARCAVVLANHHVEATQLEPIADGACGAPAPVELTSIGNAPRVTLTRPAIVTCEMVEVLGEWLKADVQPAARKLLGARIVRLDVLSSYSCRNAYGRKKTRMSEHGRANALDIKAFVTEREQPVDLLADWGMTERDIRAQIAAAAAAAKAQAEAQARAEAEARARALAARAAQGRQGGAATQEAGDEVVKGITGTIGRVVRGAGDSAPSTLTLEQPSRLGGPKAKSEAAAAPAQPVAPALPGPAAAPAEPRMLSARQQFLRQMQTTGCRRFATALGPEANDAHRNHFHFDLAERTSGSYCR